MCGGVCEGGVCVWGVCVGDVGVGVGGCCVDVGVWGCGGVCMCVCVFCFMMFYFILLDLYQKYYLSDLLTYKPTKKKKKKKHLKGVLDAWIPKFSSPTKTEIIT